MPKKDLKALSWEQITTFCKQQNITEEELRAALTCGGVIDYIKSQIDTLRKYNQ